MKKIVIDARLSGLKHAGIGRYTQMLCEHLDNFKFSPSADGFNFQIKTINPKIRHYTLAEQIQMPEILKRENPDLVHFPHFNVPLLYNSSFVVTIHDLLWHEQVGTTATTLPAWIYWLKYLAYRLVLRHAVLKSKAIIVPSNWVKKQLVRRFPQVEERINVIYEGVADKYKEEGRSPPAGEAGKREEGILELRGLEKQQYLIYTGSLYPHKNVELVLNVVQHLKDMKFVVACSRSIFWEKFKKKVASMGLEDKVILAGFVPDDELTVLYKNALAFVFPSKSEGFGLPGLEAMAAGCPVISSNAGALPEVYGDPSTSSGQAAAIYFDPTSEEELEKNIKKIKNGEEMRKRMIELGRKRVEQFSWGKMAEETMEVYAGCLGLRSGK